MPYDDQFFTFRDAARGLLKNRWPALWIFSVVVLLVVAATLLTPKRYASEAKLFVKLGRENTKLDATAALGQGPVIAASQTRESEVNSIAEIVGSQAILEQVVDSIGAKLILDKIEDSVITQQMVANHPQATLESEPWDRSFSVFNNVSEREKAIIKLKKHLEVEPIDKSNVLIISFETYSPRLAKRVMESLLEFYLKAHIRINRTSEAFEFLKGRMQIAQRDLEKSEILLKELNNASGITNPDAQRGVLLERIARLENALLDVQADRKATAVTVSEFEEVLQGLDATKVVAQTTGAGNPGIDAMREQFYELQIKREKVAARYTKEHHRRKEIEQQIVQAELILAEEEAKRTQLTRGPNATYEETRLELIKVRPRLAALEAKTKVIEKQLETARSSLEDFNANVLKVVAQAREVDVKRNNFHKYAYNVEQARIDESLEDQQISNISIAQPPTYNEKPVKPNKLLNLIAGIVLGLVTGISYAVSKEYFNPPLQLDERRLIQGETWNAAELVVEYHTESPKAKAQISQPR